MRRVAAVVLSALVLTSVHAEPIRIDSGLVEGVTLGSGVRAWLGIPQAAPPLRELRWRPRSPCRIGTACFTPTARRRCACKCCARGR